jgi:hypothetical protein
LRECEEEWHLMEASLPLSSRLPSIVVVCASCNCNSQIADSKITIRILRTDQWLRSSIKQSRDLFALAFCHVLAVFARERACPASEGTHSFRLPLLFLIFPALSCSFPSRDFTSTPYGRGFPREPAARTDKNTEQVRSIYEYVPYEVQCQLQAQSAVRCPLSTQYLTLRSLGAFVLDHPHPFVSIFLRALGWPHLSRFFVLARSCTSACLCVGFFLESGKVEPSFLLFGYEFYFILFRSWPTRQHRANRPSNGNTTSRACL